MGENKALLRYHGSIMIEHMSDMLRQAGCADIHISGIVPGYAGIVDKSPHEGPARAITDVLALFQDSYAGVLFVPVDMPLLTPGILQLLLETGGNAYFQGHPLPALLETTSEPLACRAVYKLLESVQATAIALPPESEGAFANINTKEEWKVLIS